MANHGIKQTSYDYRVYNLFHEPGCQIMKFERRDTTQ